ncbi:hypothetical protein GCM10023339_53260 [Alloalcanivorax gelatiniphagus]|tara:strand:+ start:20913 stop:22817 length:1905 start_codon:yes stop_codon:yes gene_type:complete
MSRVARRMRNLAGALAGVGMSLFMAPADAADFPGKSRTDWRVSKDAQAFLPRTPAALRVPVVVFGEDRRFASERAVVLVDAGYQQVREVIEPAWAGLDWTLDTAAPTLADWPDAWRRWWLAANPEARRVWVEQGLAPALRQAVDQGALTEPESAARQRRLVANVDSDPERMRGLPGFTAPLAGARFVHDQRVDNVPVTDSARLLDLSPILGRPATAIVLQRCQSIPLPAPVEGNWGAAPQSKPQCLVPARWLTTTLEALASHWPEPALRLSDEVSLWTPSVPVPETLPAPRWRSANGAGAPVKPAVQDLRSDDALQLKAMAPGGDGTFLLGVDRQARVEGEQRWIAELWRLDPGAQQVQVLWRAAEGADRLTDAASGVYFSGRIFGETLPALFRYHHGQVTPLPLSEDSRRALQGGAWVAAGERVWLVERGVDGIRAWRDETLSSRRTVPRGTALPGRLRVLGGGGDALWVEDDHGVAALAWKDGVTRRAFPVPPRLAGAPAVTYPDGLDPRTALVEGAGTVSEAGGWLATAFALEGPDARAGVHVLDTDKGTVLASIVLPGATRVRLAAASPDGCCLALYDDGGALTLWRARAGTMAKLLAPPATALADLSFSADGATLHGVGGRLLMSWPLD